MRTYQTDVLIAGGGPAALFMGLLLAKQGVNVLVAEQHLTFEREFRGEILQTRFVQLMQQLNLLDYLEQQQHIKLLAHDFYYKDQLVEHVPFKDADPNVPYGMWMPQPVLLGALLEKANTYPSFSMWFNATVKGLLQEGDTFTGAIIDHDGEEVEVKARVTVGADGRFSTVRRLAQFEYEYEIHDNDYIWFATDMPEQWDPVVQIVAHDNRNYVIFPRYPDKIQVGMAVPKSEWKTIQASGLDVLKAELREASPALVKFADSLQDFKPFNILQARLHLVREWAKNGCLLIGDAAHCASPVGAIGVALSVASAIVAANVVYDGLQVGDVSAAHLAKVQQNRIGEVRQVHQSQIRQMQGRLAVMIHDPVFRDRLGKIILSDEPLPISPQFTF